MTTITETAQVLIEHPSIPSTDTATGYRCPVCPAEVAGCNSPSHAEHQANALRDAGLLRRDLAEENGLSKIQISRELGQPTHVLIEADGVPLVNGYITQPSADGRPGIDREEAQVARLMRIIEGEPTEPVENRLRQLADDMPESPFTAEIIRQFANEVAQLRAVLHTALAAATPTEGE